MCRTINTTDIKLAAITPVRFARMYHAAIGDATAATNAPRDEYRVSATVASHTPSTIPPSTGESISSTPSAVATPLPPLKPSVKGNT